MQYGEQTYVERVYQRQRLGPLLSDKAWEGKASTGKEGWYFCESGEYYMKDLVKEIGKQLYKHGAIKKEEAVQFKSGEVEQLIGWWANFVFGGNSRSCSDRARQLGWKASGERGNVLDSVKEEVEVILANQKAKN